VSKGKRKVIENTHAPPDGKGMPYPLTTATSEYQAGEVNYQTHEEATGKHEGTFPNKNKKKGEQRAMLDEPAPCLIPTNRKEKSLPVLVGANR